MNDFINTELATYTDYISSINGVLRIYLFGSYANGKSHENSDIDLLVVIEDSLDAIKMAFKINRGILERKVPLDILVNRISDFEGAAIENTLQRVVKNEGVLIYDAQYGQ